ncbi:hypothetical protein QBC41DRAFT_350919 [Cercophora samala]|uniref:Uncharacterized protein n=1 Tax=Cercophora samala TaxID=330535 RepID=A0AA39YZ72_9PEZI|nr:hypothetical protein QBC41DRAFT_350919 [Cercophora samala]
MATAELAESWRNILPLTKSGFSSALDRAALSPPMATRLPADSALWKLAADNFPTGWELLGDSSANSFANTTESSWNSDADTLLRRIAGAEDALNHISSLIEPTVIGSGKETIHRLEMALMKIYQVAVFIRGDFDSRDPDDTQRDNLLRQAVDAFKEAEAAATAGLKRLGTFHAQIVETGNTVIESIRKEVELLQKTTAVDLESLKSQIDTTENTARNMENSIHHQRERMETLNKAMRDQELKNAITDGIFAGLFGPFAGPRLNFLNTRREIDEIRREMERTAGDHDRARNQLWQLQSQRQSLEQRLNQAQALSALLPGVSANASAAKAQSVMMQTQFAKLKDTATQLVLRVGEMQQGAVVTEAVAYMKKEYAFGLLQICQSAAGVDSALLDETAMVKNEIVNEYGGAMPANVQAAAAAVDEKMKLLAGTTSIRDQ